MKVIASLEVIQTECHFQISTELELDEAASKEERESKLKIMSETLQTGAINSIISKRMKDATPHNKVHKQLPTDAATAGQIKYLEDLTSKCGTTLSKWCKENGVNVNDITAKNCKEWIPILLEKAKNNYF